MRRMCLYRLSTYNSSTIEKPLASFCQPKKVGSIKGWHNYDKKKTYSMSFDALASIKIL